MAETKIKIHEKPAALTLVLCWFFIFLFPAITFQLCLQWLFDLTYQANCRVVNHELINEMTMFKKQATTEAALEKMLNTVCTSLMNDKQELAPDYIRQKIEKELGFPVAVCVTHNKNFDRVLFYQSQEFQHFIKILPRRLTQKMLQDLHLGQYSTESMKFLRQQFALISEAPLISRHITKSISGRLRGPVYFFYFPHDAAGKTNFGGGIFIVVIARQINFRKILQSSLESVNSALTRNFISSDLVLPRRLHNDNRIVSRFSADESSYSLKGMLSQEMVVDLIQRGSLLPLKIDETTRHLPLLKVMIENRHLQHPLFKFEHLFKMGLSMFVAAGGLLILYVSLFGINFRAGLREKILLGLALILLLPLALVFVASITWIEFSKIESRYMAESQLRNQAESVQQKFNDYLAIAQLQTIQLGKEIEGYSLDSNVSALKKRLKKFVIETDASLAGYDHWQQGAVYESEGENFGVHKNEEELLKGASRALMNIFDADGSFNVDYIDGVENTFTSLEPAFVNNMLSSWGRLFEYGRFRTGNRFSVVPLLFPNKATPRAMIIVKYTPRQLIEGFVRHFFKAPGFDHAISSVKFYRVEESDSSSNFYDPQSGQKVADPELVSLLGTALRGDGMSFYGHGQQLRLLKVFSELPLIMSAETGASVSTGFAATVFLLVIASAILLFAFAYLILGQIYIAPVQEFIRVTRNVALGNLNSRPEIESEDEFLQLKHAFNEMIEGIAEKEKMSQFVSQDVLHSISRDLPDEYENVGRKVEATVSFIRLPILKKLKEPEEILSLLGKFIAVVESAVNEEGGTIDKVLEDTIMLVFQTGKAKASHALAASAAALKISRQLKNQGFAIQCGIATGTVIYGRIGSRLGKLDYTVIGDTVNLAARLKAEAAAAAKTGIIIAPSTIRRLKGLAGVEFLDRIPVKGKSREYALYELLKLRA